ncbi:beta-1,3-galactosyl-O-glycosyl-glycoprotein beta-1,6-N-acetylglucosaminyltransferase 3-like [Cebidichthys violaceus]|uniref:beta-1,3-galactosyl-O-glycosyl-glycoprotein beta-1,6-N-acetylglucosaminyltransferase 3-like n=1 Tax=Cebidichthys violaceus TaxID=271503 RepID=UPI0035CC1DF5
MVIHEKIEMFERLLRAVYTPQNIYCVHVYQKSTKEFQKAVEAIISCFPNVFLASRLERVVYASWSRVQADLNCMKDLLNSQVQWRYLLNTCGTDFPIKTNGEMIKAMKTLNGRNSMETEVTNDYKKNRWLYHYNVTNKIIGTDVKKSPPPISSPMFTGNAYFVVTRDFVKHVKWGYLAGDMKNGAPYYPCTGVYRRSVCVYGAGDLPWLLRQYQLFANKFDPEVDDIAIRCIESVLRLKALGHDPL